MVSAGINLQSGKSTHRVMDTKDSKPKIHCRVYRREVNRLITKMENGTAKP